MHPYIYPVELGMHVLIGISSSDEGRYTIKIIINWRIRTINCSASELSSQRVVSKDELPMAGVTDTVPTLFLATMRLATANTSRTIAYL